MRRTLVSRKARKKRIAENAEMSGENYYSRQAEEPKYAAPPLSTEPRVPLVNGAPGADKLPTFAAFEGVRRASDEERRPLNQRSPADQVPPTTLADSRDNGNERYGPPRSRSRGQYEGPRDEYGNPLPSSNAFGPPPMDDRTPTSSRLPDQYRNDRMGPPTRGSLGSTRSRGGYPPRGGSPGEGRGGYGPRGGFGGSRGPPPQGFSGRGGFPGDARGRFNTRGRGGFPMGSMAAGGAVGWAGGAMTGRQQRGPPPIYPPNDGMSSGQLEQLSQTHDVGPPAAYDESSQPMPYTAYGARQQSPRGGMRSQSAYPPARHGSPGVAVRSASSHSARLPSPGGGYRNYSPPPPLPVGTGALVPLGKAVEMDASGSRHNELSAGYGPPNVHYQGSDSDVRGMVGLQQNRTDFASNLQSGTSPSSNYGPEEYIPPRRDWNSDSANSQGVSNSDLGPSFHDRGTLPPVELPTANSNVGSSHRSAAPRPRVNSSGSDYYEDVNPRFVAASDPLPPVPKNVGLAPPISSGGQHGMHEVSIRPTASYEDLQQGARSPAESETSNFTSVSQRGVNPNWKPGGPGDVGQFGPHPMRKPVQVQQRRDVLLENNPEFSLPFPAGRGRGGRGNGGRRPGPPISTLSGGPGGRYPGNEF